MPRWRYTIFRPCPYKSCDMHHKDNTSNSKTNTMSKKKYTTERNSWLAHCWALSLAEQCYDLHNIFAV